MIYYCALLSFFLHSLFMSTASPSPVFVAAEPIQSLTLSSSQTLAAFAHRTHAIVVKIGRNEITEYCSVPPLFKGTAYTLTDVSFCPVQEGKLAVATSTGSIAVLDVSSLTGKQRHPKSLWDAPDSSRAVNRLSWHRSDANLLASASQDGKIKIFDLRVSKKESSGLTLACSNDSVALRDIQCDPFSDHRLASVSDNGNLVIWDSRNSESPLSRITAHSSASQTLAWNSAAQHSIATGGRDKTVKVWDLRHAEESSAFIRPVHIIQTASYVARVKWRPHCIDQIAVSLIDRGDIAIYDVHMPNAAVCLLRGHAENSIIDLDWLGVGLPSDSVGSERGGSRLHNSVSSPSKSSGRGNLRFNFSLESEHSQPPTPPPMLSQHIFSADKEGKVFLQDIRCGFFPRQHMSGKVAAFGSGGGIAFHSGSIDRVTAMFNS